LAVSGFVSKDLVRNPHNLELWLKVNGKKKQQDNTSAMRFQIGELVEYFSSMIELNEGDLILTGTPSGADPIHPGDFVEAKMQQDGKDIASMFLKVSDAGL